ncbi:MAG: hypothetical protein ACRBBT_11195 [Paracoccaceae bacterium]
MAEWPEKGVFIRGETDKATGAQWVYVTPQMARAHPKGRLSLWLWLIVTYFAAVATLRGIEVMHYGAMPLAQMGIMIGIPLVCAALLALRAPWGAPLVIVLSVLSVVGSVSHISEADPVALFNTIVLIGVAVYLYDADRPNLIYRHRYRSYKSLDRDSGPSEGT